MRCQAIRAKNYFGHVGIGVIVVVLACLISGRIALGKNSQDYATAERLVEAAHQAEIAGDTRQYFYLLRESVRIAPDYKPARWQLGQLQVADEWLAVEEMQRRAAADDRQAQYREQRASLGESPEGQLALARWCRKNGLNDEAQFHWASVLAVETNHEEALRAVGKRWHNGRLLTHAEIKLLKEQRKESTLAAKMWAPRIARWRRDICGSDRAKREAALAEISSIQDVGVIPLVEAMTLGRDAVREQTADECRQICLAFLDSLGKLPDLAATESLVRHSVLSPSVDAREIAITHLKPRPLHDYVPILLGGLAMPIESSFQVATKPDGSVHYTHSLYREGQDADWSTDTRLATMQHDLGGRVEIRDEVTGREELGPRTGAEPAAIQQITQIAGYSQYRYEKTATAKEWQVSQANQLSQSRNALIFHVLTKVTGLNLGESPKDWWDWWREQNEYDAREKKAIDSHYYSDTETHYYGYPRNEIRRRPPPHSSPGSRAIGVDPRHVWRPFEAYPRNTSCFAKGTLVWTKTGQVPIESLEVGYLVVSQDVVTGELSVKPVLARTLRPKSRIIKLAFAGEELRATTGHPFWVAGIGWRMAKELGDGAILHGVTASPRVEAITPDGEEEAYNLVVADFNTYFVGEAGVLVHDNTPRRPTRTGLPTQ